jgi:sugar lactone lactonase YvrE
MAASLVIGQTVFTTSASATTAAGLNFPTGVTFDISGNLWIGDSFNNRVLRYSPPFATGMSATLVLGQANFTTSTLALTQNGFNLPFGVGFDSSGDLVVPDVNNNRSLLFSPPFSNNMNATLVIGQPNFTTNTAATTATGQNHPFGANPAF